MNKETAESPVPDREHVTGDTGRSQEKLDDADNTFEEEQAQESTASPGVSDLKKQSTSGTVEEISGETNTAAVEPPTDWFEPLEDDDEANSDRNDPEEESLAGESERSEGGERALRRYNRWVEWYCFTMKFNHMIAWLYDVPKGASLIISFFVSLCYVHPSLSVRVLAVKLHVC